MRRIEYNKRPVSSYCLSGHLSSVVQPRISTFNYQDEDSSVYNNIVSHFLLTFCCWCSMSTSKDTGDTLHKAIIKLSQINHNWRQKLLETVSFTLAGTLSILISTLVQGQRFQAIVDSTWSTSLFWQEWQRWPVYGNKHRARNLWLSKDLT